MTNERRTVFSDKAGPCRGCIKDGFITVWRKDMSNLYLAGQSPKLPENFCLPGISVRGKQPAPTRFETRCAAVSCIRSGRRHPRRKSDLGTDRRERCDNYRNF